MASYKVEVDRRLRKVIRNLPGNLRQRVLRILESLRQQPRPRESQAIDTSKAGISLGPRADLRRIRIEAWRVVYLVESGVRLVTILAIRKHPPYQYEDLRELVSSFVEEERS